MLAIYDNTLKNSGYKQTLAYTPQKANHNTEIEI